MDASIGGSRIIVKYARSVAEARAAVVNELAEGEVIVAEQLVEPAVTGSSTAWAATPQDAIGLALQGIPAASVLTAQTQTHPEELAFEVQASNDMEARVLAEHTLAPTVDKDKEAWRNTAKSAHSAMQLETLVQGYKATVHSLVTVKSAKHGFLGFGKQPATYRACPGFRHEIRFARETQWRFEVRKPGPLDEFVTELHTFIKSLDYMRNGWQKIDRSSNDQVPRFVREHLSRTDHLRNQAELLLGMQTVFQSFEIYVAPKFNDLLSDARALWPAEVAFRSIEPLQFTIPNRFDLGARRDVSELLESTWTKLQRFAAAVDAIKAPKQ
jgi:hypothetical protein